ncbi:MAG TPA: ABC transporter ATP-binding protein [Solirubrobacteraceae bacterium]|nr:ABC transporter ATP-binding protein [Solirubrobacteraceae bacterium]
MPIIEVEHLHKRYGEAVGIEDVSFAVDEGEIFGVLGPNGAGKTTTVECIEGLRTADGGTIRVLGLDPARDGAQLREVVGAQLQESQLPEKLEVGEALALYRSFYRAPAEVAELVDALGLGPVLSRRFGKLSGGEKQRLSIALALIGNPRIAVLDELTTGLDPAARRDTWALIEDVRARGVTIILVTHFMEEAERLCDRVAVIDAGRIVAVDTPDALAAGAQTGQRIRFRTRTAVDERALEALPAVTSVAHNGEQMDITGADDALAEVAAFLAREGIVVEQLRVDQASLEDAFVALTGSAS